MCSICVLIAVFAGACADGTGTPFSPILPSTSATTANADGTTLKATAPAPQTPSADSQVSNLRPTLTVANASGTYGQLALSYVFQLYEGDTLLRQTDSMPSASNSTSWQVPADLLKYQRTYRWRARALSTGVEGPWSAFASFRTPAPPLPEGPGQQPGAGPVACAGSSGLSIVQCVGAAFPDKLDKVSLEQRKANMEFLRDRIIETARCKGMDLGRNFKRGTPEISVDFAVLRQPGLRDRGVDLASGYDDITTRLRLTWQELGAPTYGHPFYAGYPAVDCSGVN